MAFKNTKITGYNGLQQLYITDPKGSLTYYKCPKMFTLTSAPEPDIRWRFCLLLMMVWMAEKKSSLRTTISPSMEVQVDNFQKHFFPPFGQTILNINSTQKWKCVNFIFIKFKFEVSVDFYRFYYFIKR